VPTNFDLAHTLRPRHGDDVGWPIAPEVLALLGQHEELADQHYFHTQRNAALVAFRADRGFWPVHVAVEPGGLNDIGASARTWHVDPVLRITEQRYREHCLIAHFLACIEAANGVGPGALAVAWQAFRNTVAAYERGEGPPAVADYPFLAPVSTAVTRLRELQRTLVVQAAATREGRKRERSDKAKAKDKREGRKRRRACGKPSPAHVRQRSPSPSPPPISSLIAAAAAVAAAGGR